MSEHNVRRDINGAARNDINEGPTTPARNLSEVDHIASPPVVQGNQDRTVLERAKGALMLRYGVGSHLALAVLARWSRESQTPITGIADRLLRDLDGSDPIENADPNLARWLDSQLRHTLAEIDGATHRPVTTPSQPQTPGPGGG